VLCCDLSKYRKATASAAFTYPAGRQHASSQGNREDPLHHLDFYAGWMSERRTEASRAFHRRFGSQDTLTVVGVAAVTSMANAIVPLLSTGHRTSFPIRRSPERGIDPKGLPNPNLHSILCSCRSRITCWLSSRSLSEVWRTLPEVFAWRTGTLLDYTRNRAKQDKMISYATT